MRAFPWLTLFFVAGCVPIEPLELRVPDARPPECVAATDCVLPDAEAACIDGRCVVEGCVTGRADADGDPLNGCEGCAPLPGPDGCDDVDSDCDGRLDEDGDGTVEACGACDRPCAGAGATSACVDDRCVIDACVDGRYAVGGPEVGCPCAVDGLLAASIPIRLPPEPVAARYAFPGTGAPGVAVWVEARDNRHRLMRWGVSAAGHTLGAPSEIAALPGPSAVADAWFTADGDVLAILAEPMGNDERLTVWRGDAPRVLADDCRDDRCRVVRLPERGAGLVRRVVEGDRVRVLGPDGETLARWDRPVDGPLPEVDLIDAACLHADFCLAAVRRGGLRLVGAVDADLDAFDELELQTIGDRIWLVGRIDDSLVAAAASMDEGSDPVGLPVDGWRAPRLLPTADGGAWLVARDDDEPVGLLLDDALMPRGEPRPLTGGFTPVGLAAPGLFFDHSPRAATAERLVWVGLPDPRPAEDAPPTTVDDRLVYTGGSGLFTLSLDADEPVEPTLVSRRLGVSTQAPAAAAVDGRALVVDIVPEGLAVIDLDFDPAARTPRHIELLFEGEPAVLRPGASVALSADGRVAVVGVLADGQPVFVQGDVSDAALTLATAGLAPEADVALLGVDGAAQWTLTRAEPGIGFESVVRRLDGDGQTTRLVARRFARPAAALALDDRLVLVWLDRQSDRCGDGPDRLLLTTLSDAGPAASLPHGILPVEGCPQEVALIDDHGGAYLLVRVDDDLEMTPLGPDGRPAAPAVRVAVDAPGQIAADKGPTARWMTREGAGSLEFDCRAGAE